MNSPSFLINGIARLYGIGGAEKITNAHVCVVGIGGVGSWAAEALARTGIGELTLIDMDDICVTNINRQIHALKDTVGEIKVKVMAERIKAINPSCQIHTIEDFLTAETLTEYLKESYHYVIDAIDNAQSKAAIIAYCKRKKIPILSIGGAGGKTDPSKIYSSDLRKTFNDPLLAKVRSQLRYHYGFSRNPKRSFGVPCVYSTEQPVYPSEGGQVCQKKSFNDGLGLDCGGGLGSVTHITASFAFFAVSKVIRKIVSS